MDTPTIISLISIGTTAIVGIILSRQIRSQSEIIDKYKKLVEAYNPDKIITLHEREVLKIKETLSLDNSQLKSQIIEIGTFAYKSLEIFKLQHDSVGKEFIIDQQIKMHMPNSLSVLNEINNMQNNYQVHNNVE